MTTPARMPTSLVILLVLVGLGVISNFVSGAIVSAVLGAALVVGLIAGNDGVRSSCKVSPPSRSRGTRS